MSPDPEASPEGGAQSDEVAGVSVGENLDKQPAQRDGGETAVSELDAEPKDADPPAPVGPGTTTPQESPPVGVQGDEAAGASVGDDLDSPRPREDAGEVSVSQVAAQRERAAGPQHARRVTGASEEPEERGGRRTQVLIVVGAIVVVAALAVVAALILRHVHQQNSSSAPPAPTTPHLRVPATIAGYSAQAQSVYQTSSTLYANYQRLAPASSFAVSAFAEKSTKSAADSVATSVKAAQQNYGSVSPITTQKRGGTTYSCFTGTETQQNQTIPATVCGWSSGLTTFTMVLAPSSNERQAAILAKFVTAGIR